MVRKKKRQIGRKGQGGGTVREEKCRIVSIFPCSYNTEGRKERHVCKRHAWGKRACSLS